jgi:hypothetical protein
MAMISAGEAEKRYRFLKSEHLCRKYLQNRRKYEKKDFIICTRAVVLLQHDRHG